MKSSFEVPDAKLSDYLLDETHPTGRAKARFFLALGFAKDGVALRAALLDHPIRNLVQRSITTSYGEKTVVRCQFLTPDGRNPCIVTVWMEEPGEPLRLVTAYPD